MAAIVDSKTNKKKSLANLRSASPGGSPWHFFCDKLLPEDRQRGYGATVARLTPDQKVGSSNLSALITYSSLGRYRSRGVVINLARRQGLFWELNPGPLAPEARIMPLDQTANKSQLFIT